MITGLLKYFAVSFIVTVVLFIINFILKICIDPGKLKMNVNEFINIVIRGVCGVGIVGYFIYKLRK